MATKVIVNTKVRALLLELDEIMTKYHEASASLVSGVLKSSQAMNVSADREGLKIQIMGVAYRINEASIWRGK